MNQTSTKSNDIEIAASGQSQQESREDAIVKNAGRGTIFITMAKLYFIVTGYGIYFALPRLLTPKEFGIYGFVTGVVSIINAVIVIGTQQAVSKFVSEDARRADAIRSLALKLQCLIGGGITIGYFFAAPLIARSVNDPDLIKLLRISALIPLAYTFYSVYVGYLNGQRKFFRQSLLDMSYSTFKVAMIVGLAFLFHSVGAAIAGFGLAAVVVLVLSPFIAGRAGDQVDIKPTAATFIKFQFALIGFTLANNLLQKIDLILIKALGSASSDVASEMAGYYTAAAAIANITYQAIISITFVIFPLVSMASVEARSEELKSYIQQTLKYTLMIMALSATIFSSNAAPVLQILYREIYVKGAPALAILAYGMLCFGLIYILTTIISGSGRPRISLAIGVGVLVLSAILNALLVPRYGLVGAATATTVAMAIGVLTSGLYVWRVLGAFAPVRSLISISLAAAISYQIAAILPAELIFKKLIFKLAMIIAVQSLCYLIVLLITREIGVKEIRSIRKIISI